MPRREPNREVWPAALVALALIAGCSSTPTPRPGGKASSTILDGGPRPKVTRREAADVEYSLGRSFEGDGKLDEARASYLAAVAKDPARGDAEARLAILDDRRGDAAGADRHFARAIKLRPKDPEVLCDRGYCLYLRRRWSDAEASLKKALAVDPGHARSHANLGLVLARRGSDESALAEFARAGCDPADARSNLALVMALEGRFEESRGQYALALKSKPGSAVAREGFLASTVALKARDGAEAIAAAPPADRALVRTSAPAAP